MALFWEVHDSKPSAWELNSNGHAWHRRVLSDVWSTDHGYLLHSKDGAFGQGRILATAYQPWNLTIDPLKMCSDWRVSQDTSWCWRGGNATPNDSTDDFSRFQRKSGKSYEFKADACHPAVATEESCEAVKFIRNLVTMAGDDLMVDYGAPIPTTMAVGSARRLALVNSPALGGMVTVRLQLHVWGTTIVRAPTPEAPACVPTQLPYNIDVPITVNPLVTQWLNQSKTVTTCMGGTLNATLSETPTVPGAGWRVLPRLTAPSVNGNPGHQTTCERWDQVNSLPPGPAVCAADQAGSAGTWTIDLEIEAKPGSAGNLQTRINLQ